MSSLTSLKGEHHTAQHLCSACFAQCALPCTLSRGLNHLPYTVSHPLRVFTCMSSFDFAVTLCPEVYQVDFRFEHGESGFHNSNNSHGLSKREEGPWPLDCWLDPWPAASIPPWFSLQPFIHLQKPDIGLRLSNNSAVGKAQILAPEWVTVVSLPQFPCV